MLEPAATGMLLKPGVAFLWLFNLLARCQLLHEEEVSDQLPDDIGSPKRCGLNETIVLVVGIPASSLWLGSLVNPRW